MHRVAGTLLILLLVVGCGKPGGVGDSKDVTAVAAASAASAKTSGKKSEAAKVSPSAPMLAYVYAYTIEAPIAGVSPLLHNHEAACRAAGPTVCQVVGASIETESRDRATGKLELRAEPGWLQSFREHLESDARAARGKLIHGATTTEDLTRQIIDTDAGIRARTLLRGRLEQLLATRPGKLSELIELEQELARVQGEIDAAQSEEAVMRTRVAMSSLTLQYDSKPPLSTPGAFEPVQEAARSFVGNVATGVAALLTLASYLLPFVLAGAGVLWLMQRFRKRRPTPSAMAHVEAGKPATSKPIVD